MDLRRFFSFLAVSIAVMMLFSILFPPPAQEKAKPGQQVAGQKAEGQKAEDPAAKKAEDGKADEPKAPAEPAPANVEPAAAAAQPGEPAKDVELQFVTLGSLDVNTGYRMLVTLTNAGAAVKRAEMASSRYTDRHDWSGYLGELELKKVDGGLQVQVVGPGTPAALATPKPIAVGDVIVAFEKPKVDDISTIARFNAALKKTNPGDSITLQVRSGDGAPEARTVKVVRRPLAVLRPEAENFAMRDEPLPPGFIDPPSFPLRLISLKPATLEEGAAAPAALPAALADELEKGHWEIAEQKESVVAFRRALPEQNLEIIKRFTLEPVPEGSRQDPAFPGYHVKLNLEFRNTSPAAQAMSYRLDGPTGLPIEGWWFAHKISRNRWFAAAGLRDVVVRFDDNHIMQINGPEIGAEPIPAMGQGQALAFGGVDAQYFASMMIPKRQSLQEVWFDSVEAVLAGESQVELADGQIERRPPVDPRAPATLHNVTTRMTRKPIVIEAGQAHVDEYTVFIGPKRPALLAQYKAANDPNYSLQDVIYYGLSLFGFVAKAMLAILHFFYAIVGNYGIAIIMLTVLVRGCLFPLSYKQTKNMAKMQALKPEMDRITEKYKTDMQKRSQAMQELYRKHQINPLGGCLPMLLQLPIFIGLYRALMVDVELRQSPLFGSAIRWCSDLAAPDMLYNWSWFMPDFITRGHGFFALGPYFNVLPLITVALFLVTQKMFMPEPQGEQAIMQAKMMKYMTGFMGLLFYKVASGLCLYFIASSLWGIAERKLLPKAKGPDAATDGSLAPATGTGSKDGANGRPGKKDQGKVKRRK